MKQIKINNLEEKLFYEKLNNGLEVFLVPLENKKNYYLSFNVKYGNSYMDFKKGKEKVHVPAGVAHFLEHKLFEKNDIKYPFEFFAETGTDVNAATSIKYTSYYCRGNSSFEKNLTYLLNWITKIDITDEKVEKEKGIIIQESRMHLDNPARLIYHKLRNNLFIKDTYGKKVIGEEDDILNITKEDLITAYNSFYRPDNMFIVAVGNIDPDKTIKIIQEELKDFKNPNYKVLKINVSEPLKVKKEKDKIKMNISIPRIALGYKMDLNKFKLDKYKLDICISMILKILFGSTSDFYEEGLKKDLFIDFHYNLEMTFDKVVISFFATSNKKEDLLKSIKESLDDIKVSAKEIERVKKVWIANEIKILDNIHVIANDILYDVISYNKYKNNKIKELKNITFQDIEEVRKNLSFENSSLVEIETEN